MSGPDDGYLLVRREGHHAEFNLIARDIIDNAGDELAVFATSDGQSGYERIFVVPL